MIKKKKKWTFDSFERHAKSTIKKSSVEAEANYFRELMYAPDSSVQNKAATAWQSVGQYLVQAAIANIKNDPDLAWSQVKRAWRYELFRWKIYIDRMAELLDLHTANPATKPVIGKITDQEMAKIALLAAMSALLGEVDAVNWLLGAIRSMLEWPSLLIEQPKYNGGQTHDLILSIFKVNVVFSKTGLATKGALAGIIDDWKRPEDNGSAISRMAGLHEQKSIDRQAADLDGVYGLQYRLYSVFPVECILMDKVRRESGLKVDLACDIMRSPFWSVPLSIEDSENDKYLEESLVECSKLMDVKWEW